jgi:flagellar biosynthetic protein FliP
VSRKTNAVAGLVVFLGVLVALPALAQETGGDSSILDAVTDAVSAPRINTTMGLFLLITVLTLAPSILVMTTAFTRIIVVFGFLRQAMGTQQSPPNQVLVGLALILTAFIMRPVYEEVYDVALQPYMNGELTEPGEAFDRGMKPIRDFMFTHTGDNELIAFLEAARLEEDPETIDDVPTTVLMSAFVLSEMTTAFKIGFLIYIPFLIIDMVVASALMAMGMMMLPPVFVSLPFKLALFVLADGWALLIIGLIDSFNR